MRNRLEIDETIPADETKYEDPGATLYKSEVYNDGFADNNPESLFHGDEIRNLDGGDIPRTVKYYSRCKSRRA